MIKERPLETNPYLKMRGESQLRAKFAFERRAGWRFGFTFGALVVLIAYVWDAAQLLVVHNEYWWVKFVLSLVTILALSILAGGIGGYVNWLLKLPVWMLFGVAAGWCAINIPFGGARLLLQNFDPSLQLVEFLPIPAAAADSFGMLATLGACFGIVIGLLQTVLVNWAWERSTEDYKITLGGWAMFLLILPIAFGYSILLDGAANMPLRAPQQLVHSIVQSGLNDAPGQDQDQMELHRALIYVTGQTWRKTLTPEYTMRLAASEPTYAGESYVDVTFSNGTNLRCRVTTYGEFAGACFDLTGEYSRYISEFIPRGSFRCGDCQARVTQQALEWRGQNARPLTDTDRIQLNHGAGSSIVVRVQSATDNSFECLIWGVNPIIVEQCKNI